MSLHLLWWFGWESRNAAPRFYGRMASVSPQVCTNSFKNGVRKSLQKNHFHNNPYLNISKTTDGVAILELFLAHRSFWAPKSRSNRSQTALLRSQLTLLSSFCRGLCQIFANFCSIQKWCLSRARGAVAKTFRHLQKMLANSTKKMFRAPCLWNVASRSFASKGDTSDTHISYATWRRESRQASGILPPSRAFGHRVQAQTLLGRLFGAEKRRRRGAA